MSGLTGFFFFLYSIKDLQKRITTTLPMIYFATLQGRYRREQETMATPQPLDKEHLNYKQIYNYKKLHIKD